MTEPSPRAVDSSPGLAPRQPGALARDAASRAEFLARFVPPETRLRLEEAHTHFFGVLSQPGLGVVERTLVSSVATNELRSALRGDIIRKIYMPLMNTPVGFDTDQNPAKWSGYGKKPEPYGEDVVLECAVHSWLMGLPPVGNLFNIIASGMYPRKEGFEFLVSQFARVTAKANVPAINESLYNNGGYLTVPVTAKYRLLSEPEDSEPEIFAGVYDVRLNRKNAVGVEATAGKAKRKLYRDLFGVLTGTMLPDPDEVPDEPSVLQVGAHFGGGDDSEAVLAGAGAEDAADAPADGDDDSGEAPTRERDDLFS